VKTVFAPYLLVDGRPRGGFAGQLEPQAWRDLQNAGRPRTYHSGHPIYEQGDLSTHVVVLLHGSAKVTRSAAGRQTLLAIRTPGDVLGEAEALRDAGRPDPSMHGRPTGRIRIPRAATAEALVDTTALVIGADKFTSFLASWPDAWVALAHDRQMQLEETYSRLSDMASDSANRRLANALLAFSMKTGVGHAGSTIPLSQAELASWIGVNTATVERALGDWRRRGIVETKYRSITITQLAELKRIAGILQAIRPATVLKHPHRHPPGIARTPIR
jgi:CRP/FNR family transcriptional regulator, cyclic AMP receptor protein